MTVSSFALAIATVEVYLHCSFLESYCIIIRVILLQIKNFAGTLRFILFQQV